MDQFHTLLWVLGVLPPSSLLALINLVIIPVVLTATLFLGPLSLLYLERNLIFQTNCDFRRDVIDIMLSLEGMRNYIVVCKRKGWGGIGRWCTIRSPSYTSRLALLGLSHLTETILFKGPLTEEFVFRACVIALLHFAGYSNMYLVFASSLYFGIGEFCFFFSQSYFQYCLTHHINKLP